MWFEKAFLWLQQVEKVVIFPMVILSALTMDLEKMKEPNANHWLGAITLVVCGLKLLRSAFSDCAKQFMVLLVTLLYFQYNADTGMILGKKLYSRGRYFFKKKSKTALGNKDSVQATICDFQSYPSQSLGDQVIYLM